mgnify:CR=1 FL=1
MKKKRKLGQMDFDPDKDYSREEPTVSIKTIDLIFLSIIVIIAIAAGIMCLYLHM